MKISVGVSGRHFHITESDYRILFGTEEINNIKDLKQRGEYATDKVITVKGPKGEIEKVRLLAPFREYTQVEISKTDSYKLGVNPPVRDSGDIEGSALISLIGPNGSIEKECCIIATRHIHISKSAIKHYGFNEFDTVDVLVRGVKPTVFSGVKFKVSDEAYFELHIDLDDANAALINQGDILEILEKQ